MLTHCKVANYVAMLPNRLVDVHKVDANNLSASDAFPEKKAVTNGPAITDEEPQKPPAA